ncbi:MAG: hypothetical protein KKE55_03965, partial [Candidatus Omnitrophica bacterium]|nr:hypothetical protein [Candidatus Omnitrophota bacterium]
MGASFGMCIRSFFSTGESAGELLFFFLIATVGIVLQLWAISFNIPTSLKAAAISSVLLNICKMRGLRQMAGWLL